MMGLDIQYTGMLLVGGSITCAGVLIALVVLVVIGAAMMIISDYQSTQAEQ